MRFSGLLTLTQPSSGQGRSWTCPSWITCHHGGQSHGLEPHVKKTLTWINGVCCTWEGGDGRMVMQMPHHTVLTVTVPECGWGVLLEASAWGAVTASDWGLMGCKTGRVLSQCCFIFSKGLNSKLLIGAALTGVFILILGRLMRSLMFYALWISRLLGNIGFLKLALCFLQPNRAFFFQEKRWYWFWLNLAASASAFSTLGWIILWGWGGGLCLNCRMCSCISDLYLLDFSSTHTSILTTVVPPDFANCLRGKITNV